MTEEQFKNTSSFLRSNISYLSNDIVIQGSRAACNARPDSDLDIAIRVSQTTFDNLIKQSFGNPNQGSAKEKTMNHAIEIGKITAGDLRPKISNIREQARTLIGGMKIDLSVIKVGGPFDPVGSSPYISLLE